MALFEIKAPDGGTYQVEAPEDATDEQIQAYVQKQISAPVQQAPPKGSSLVDEVKHQLGLTGRWAAKGVTGLPEIVGNAANAAVNYGVRGVNSLTGTNIPQLPSLSSQVDRGLDAVGLSQPRDQLEQGLGVVASAVGGAGAANVAQMGAQMIPRVAAAAPTIADQVLGELARAPVMQAVGAGGAYLASQGAQSMGITNPLALTAIGMIGGGATGTGATLAGRTAGGIAQSVKPFTTAGRDVIVGRALNRVASNPTQAADTLDAVREIIPGSRPTVGQSSRDAGLIAADSAMRGLDETGLIPGRIGEQNTARQKELYRVAGDEGTVAAAKAYQKAAYDELAAPAFERKQPVNIGRTVDDNPVLETIELIRNSPKGARKSVQSALDHAEEQLTQPKADLTDAETLYEIRKDLALARDGKLSGKGKDGAELSSLKNAKAELNRVIASLDDVIESGAPGFKDYLSEFHQRSIPLDQLRAMQRIRSQAELAVSDSVNQVPILGNKFQTLLKNNLDAGLNLRGKGPKAGNLNQDQLSTLGRIAADLDRSSAATAATMKSPGSDTFKNLSVASVIGRVLGDETGGELMQTATGKTLARPLNFLYRVPDREIQQLMLQAWLDPKLASQLMRKANQREIENIAATLKRRAADNAIGASIYAAE